MCRKLYVGPKPLQHYVVLIDSRTVLAQTHQVLKYLGHKPPLSDLVRIGIDKAEIKLSIQPCFPQTTRLMVIIRIHLMISLAECSL